MAGSASHLQCRQWTETKYNYTDIIKHTGKACEQSGSGRISVCRSNPFLWLPLSAPRSPALTLLQPIFFTRSLLHFHSPDFWPSPLRIPLRSHAVHTGRSHHIPHIQCKHRFITSLVTRVLREIFTIRQLYTFASHRTLALLTKTFAIKTLTITLTLS